MGLHRRFQRANPGDTIAQQGKLYNDIASSLEAVVNLEAVAPLMLDSAITGYRLSLAMPPRGREAVITEKLGFGFYRARIISDQLADPTDFSEAFSLSTPTGTDEIVIIQHVTEHDQPAGVQLSLGDPVICYAAGVTTETVPTPVYRVFGDILPRPTAFGQVMMGIDDLGTIGFRFVQFHE